MGSLTSRNSLAGHLEKLRQVGDGLGVLPWCGEPREWGVSLDGLSFSF